MSPDRIFGLIKMRYAHADIDTFRDFVQCVVDASPSGFSLAVPTFDPLRKIIHVRWFEWDVFLRNYYAPLPHITSFHHFIFEPNVEVQCKEYVNSEINVVKTTNVQPSPASDARPAEITPPGLSLRRRWYLFKEMR